MRPNTKSARIRQLLDAGTPRKEIATIVGCSQEYVRVVVKRAGMAAPAKVQKPKVMRAGQRYFTKSRAPP